jgi:hypothetical protein
MRRLLCLTLSFAVCLPGLVALRAATARAQQVASAGNLDTLRRQYEQMLAVERSAATPPEVRELNRTFLEERRAQLAAAIRNRIGALDKYRAAVAGTLSDAEQRAIDDSVARLSAELQALLPEAVPTTGTAARRTRRPARAASAQPAPVAEASFDANAPAAAEPAAPEAAAPEPAPSTTTKPAAPIEIVSPERDRVVHTGEVELEVSVKDDSVDDLMVAVYTPASEKPKTARVLNVKRSDRGSKSIVVALSRGDNRVEVSDLKHGEVKAERHITYQPPEAPALNAANAAFVAPGPALRVAPAPAPALGAPKRRDASDSKTDHGRMVGLLLGGAVMSQQGENFSQADPFLGFIAGYDHFEKEDPLKASLHWRVQGIFQVQPKKEEAPETAEASASPSPSPTPAASPTPTPVFTAEGFQPFLASRKTFDIEMQLWYDWAARNWIFFGREDSRNYDVRVGVYGTIGASTYLDKNELQGDDKVKVKKATADDGQTELDPQQAKIDNDLNKYWEVGLIGNFFHYDRGTDNSRDLEHPKLFLRASVGYGNYESMEGFNPGKTGFLNNSRNRFIGKLRVFPQFLDSNPTGDADSSPMFGVEINAGRGPDQIKFFTGVATAFKLFKRATSSAPTPTTTATTTDTDQ